MAMRSGRGSASSMLRTRRAQDYGTVQATVILQLASVTVWLRGFYWWLRESGRVALVLTALETVAVPVARRWDGDRGRGTAGIARTEAAPRGRGGSKNGGRR